MDTNICMAESLHCSPETSTTLLVIWLYPNTKLKVLKSNKKSQLEKGNQMPSRFYALFCDCCYAHFCKNVPNKPIKSSYIIVIKLKKKVSLSIRGSLAVGSETKPQDVSSPSQHKDEASLSLLNTAVRCPGFYWCLQQ